MARCIACGSPARIDFVEATQPGASNMPVLYVDVQRIACEGSCGRVRLNFRGARRYREGVIPRFVRTKAALEIERRAAERFNAIFLRIGLVATAAALIGAVLLLPFPLAYKLGAIAAAALSGGWIARSMGRRETLPEYFPIPAELVEQAKEARDRIDEAVREATGAPAPATAVAVKAPTAAAGAKAEAATSAPTAPTETVPMKVVLNGETHELSIGKGDNMLDAALERNVEIDYSCLEGMCDSCAVRVLAGAENISAPTPEEVDMLGDEIQEGMRLACQVVVNGPVEIEQNH